MNNTIPKLYKKSDITSITIGGFDGMHLAHQELFKSLDNNGAIVVIETGYANLTPLKYRQEYTTFPLYYYPLDEIKHLNAEDFLSIINEEYPNLKTIVVGFDFKFGNKAKYDVNDLKALFQGQVIVVNEFNYENIPVHSRIIRDYLSSGYIQKANILLNKNYSLVGLHIRGQGLGAKQFVPTINLKTSNFLIPQAGIYATYTYVNNIKYLSATFIGHRVSTDGQFAIETHIIDKELNEIYSQVKIEFLNKIRNNHKFDNYKDLENQILNDIMLIKQSYKESL